MDTFTIPISMKNLILIAATLLAGCSKKNNPTIVEGRVIDGITRQSIENVEISASENTGGILDTSTPANPSRSTTFSREDGSYVLEIEASETAETYAIHINKEQYCERLIQSVEAGKSQSLNIEIYKKATVERQYNLQNRADSLVEGIGSRSTVFDEGGCGDCFVGSYRGDDTCFQESAVFEGIQGFDYTFWYKLYQGKTLLKTDTINYFLDQNEFSIEINL